MRRLPLLGLVIAFAADAQSFSDDFENGTAAWSLAEPTAAITIVTSRDAAHRGANGLRVTDSDGTPVSRQGSTLGRAVPLLGSSAYSRGWVRVRSANQLGSTVFLSTSWRQGSTYAAATFWQLEGASLVAGSEPFGPQGKVTLTARIGPVDGGWHLLETSLTGIGTDAGVATYFIDGEQVARLDSLGAAAAISDFDVGAVYGQGAHQWEADFDDLALGPRPFPQRLTVTTPASIVEGGCVELQVGVSSSVPSPDGQPTERLSVSGPVTLSLDGVGPVFSDSSCATPITNPVLTRDGRQLFFRGPDAGRFEVRVRDAENDLLPASREIESGAARPGRADSYFALACSTSPSLVGLLSVVLFLSRWRPRR